MNGETIYSDRVKQARELKRLTQKQVADAVGVNQSTIARIEDGTTLSPLYDLLSAIAHETDVTVEFFRREPVKPFPKGSLVYRARSRITLGEQNQAHQYAKLLVEQTQRMGKRLSLPALQLPICEDPAQAARLTRGVLGIAPLIPMPHLVNHLERHGIVVFGLPFMMEKVDAFSAWAEMDGERPFVALSGDCPGDRTRFSVAHELGHLVIHKGLDGRNQDLEAEANQFAAEFPTTRGCHAANPQPTLDSCECSTTQEPMEGLNTDDSPSGERPRDYHRKALSVLVYGDWKEGVANIGAGGYTCGTSQAVSSNDREVVWSRQERLGIGGRFRHYGGLGGNSVETI